MKNPKIEIEIQSLIQSLIRNHVIFFITKFYNTKDTANS